MKKFNIYKHPLLGIQAVKVGFTWPGFFFGVIWMLICKLWLYAIILVVARMFIALGYRHKDPMTDMVMVMANVGITFFIGFAGNQWREDNLVKRGFKKVLMVKARNRDAALAIFCDEHLKV